MKYCQKCGKEIMDEAVVCPGCGCSVVTSEIKNVRKSSTFKRNRILWIITLSIFCVIFAIATVSLLDGVDSNIDMYQYYNSDIGSIRKQIGGVDAVQWYQDVEEAKANIMLYSVGVGLCGLFSLASLIGDICFIATKKADN